MLIAFIGDLHGEARAVHRVNNWAEYAKVDLLVAVGDTGYKFDWSFNAAIASGSVPWWYIRGNHDDPDRIRELTGGELAGKDLLISGPNLTYVPDGYECELGGVKFAFIGGATSVDKQARTEGVSWWPEEVTPEGLEMKEADVLVCHDSPYWVPALSAELSKFASLFPPEMLVESKANRAILAEYAATIKPVQIIHGHYHHFYESFAGDGTYMAGLDMSSGGGGWSVFLMEVDDGIIVDTKAIHV